MVSTKRSPWSVSLLLLTTALVAACSGHRREAYIQDRAGAHVYRMPLAEVWPHARMLLKEKGFSMREVPGSFEISTEWLQTSPASSLGTTYVRYLVRGQAQSPSLSKVEFLRQNRTESGAAPVDARTGKRDATFGNDTTHLTRDLEMEWELLQRVDPEAAKAVRAEVEQKYP